MASKQALSRLRKELKAIVLDPPPNIHVHCDESNILHWSYLLEGPADTPYEGGWYWGRLKFPKEYPFAPPSILMVTPNGRFETNTRLCLSMSDYHPESWQPAWSLATVLKGLLSFMCEDIATAGSCPETTVEQKRKFAQDSLAWNKDQGEFMRCFPEIDSIVTAREAAAASAAASTTTTAPPAEVGYSPQLLPQAGELSQNFVPGNAVRLLGLKARSDLNGREAVVKEPSAAQAAAGRIHVCVNDTTECVGVKPENLELLTVSETIVFEKD